MLAQSGIDTAAVRMYDSFAGLRTRKKAVDAMLAKRWFLILLAMISLLPRAARADASWRTVLTAEGAPERTGCGYTGKVVMTFLGDFKNNDNFLQSAISSFLTKSASRADLIL